MKKYLILLLVVLMLLPGCGKKEEPEMLPLSELIEAPPEEPEEQTPVTQEPPVQQEPQPEVPQKQEEPVEQPEEPQEETPQEQPPEEPVEEDDGLPDVFLTDWQLLLANASHNIEEYEPELAEVEGHQVDARIVEPLKAFMAAAREEGLSVYLSSAYRDYANQSYLYNRKVAQYGDPAVAATIVAPPGTSEHQTGLACDITDRYYELKNSSLENTALFQWMSQHCHEYGFIVRYPKDKEAVTGIIYEPWHFRYVGVEVATYIMENGLCLEEFLALYEEPAEE